MVSLDGCLCFVQCLPRLLPTDSWDRLQSDKNMMAVAVGAVLSFVCLDSCVSFDESSHVISTFVSQ